MVIKSHNNLAVIENGEQITSGELVSWIMSPGTVYWYRRQGRPVKLLMPGQIVDPAFLKKFPQHEKFIIQRVFDQEACNPVLQYFELLKSADNEKDRITSIKYIINWLDCRYFRGTDSGQLLDLALVGIKAFYQLTPATTKDLIDLDIDMFQKSALIAACSIFYALCMGYTDYLLLQDLYHLLILRDFHFSKERISFTQKQLLESTFQDMEKINSNCNVSMNDKKIISEHSERSAILVSERLRDIFHYPELISTIKVHHENLKGSGWPNKLNDDELNDLERIVIFVESIFPCGKLAFVKNDGKEFIDLYQKNKIKDVKDIIDTRLIKIVDETIRSLILGPEQ